MAVNTTTDNDGKSRGQDPTECRPLREAATPELFRRNAFRIMGLQVDATTREIAKHLDKVRLLKELGQVDSGQPGAFPLRPPPSVQGIRDAEQKLRDPERRIIDEFFWFWPTNSSGSKSDPALHALAGGDTATAENIWKVLASSPEVGAVATHNLAVRWHLAALGFENQSIGRQLTDKQRQTLESCWLRALRHWDLSSTDDLIWERVSTRILELDDPRLRPDFGRRMRGDLPHALVAINASLAVTHAEEGETGLAKMHVRLMRDSKLLLANPNEFTAAVLVLIKERVREQILRGQQHAEAASDVAPVAAHDLCERVNRYVELLGAICDPGNNSANELLDEAAGACVTLLVAHQRKAGNNHIFVDELERILAIARGAEVRQRVEENIAIGRQNLARAVAEPVYERLSALAGSDESASIRLERFRSEIAPRLTDDNKDLKVSSEVRTELFDIVANVLHGISVDAWNKTKDSVTAIAAMQLAMQYVCDAEAKPKLYTEFTTLIELVGQHRKQQVWKKLKIAGWVVGGLWVILAASGVFDSNKQSSSTINTPLVTSSSQMPDAMPASADSSQTTYRVPNNVAAELERDRQALEFEKAKANRLEARLEDAKGDLEREMAAAEALQSQIQASDAQIEGNRSSLDTDDQIAVDNFNREVNEHNALVLRGRARAASANERVAPYNELVEQVQAQNLVVNRLVDAYNEKLRNYGR
jgi:hypothetical protein